MIEHLKTYVLIGLVGLSIVLTWQIWTYKPLYDYLLPTEYVLHEGIAERRELNDLIRPEKIVYQYPEERYTVAYPDDIEYTNIMKQQMKNWSFFGFREVEPIKHWRYDRKKYEGVELIYPTNIPLSTFKDLFTIDTGDRSFPDISHIFLYINPTMNEVYAMFTNYEEQKLLRASTNIPVSELRQYLLLGENHPEYVAFAFDDRTDHLPEMIYLSQEPVSMAEYRYFSRAINLEALLSSLFVDPSLVRQIQDRNGETFFTDGTRGLRVNRNKRTIQYVHPIAERPDEEVVNQQVIQRSVSFVNQHRGWEPTFYLSNYYNLSPNEAVVEFRRYLNQYPVYSENIEDEHSVVKLEVQDGRVVSYNRSLLQIDRVMNQVKRELPSAVAVIEALREENISFKSIKNIHLGYISVLGGDHLAYRPVWVIEWQDEERSYLRNIKQIAELSKGRMEKEERDNELE